MTATNTRFFENGHLVAGLSGDSAVEPSGPWYGVLGDKILTGDGKEEAPEKVLAGKKVVGLYFSGSWCPPCKRFTPVLSDLYKSAKASDPSAFECVFLTSCNDKENFDEYRAKMPFPAIPYDASQGSPDQPGAGFVRKAKRESGYSQGILGAKYGIASVPTLVLVDGETGETLSAKAHETTPATDGGPESYDWYEGPGNSAADKAWNAISKPPNNAGSKL
eukprot:gnl/MRDRNA2_/MRDRNA2_137972_c0_seq1.p1 gnl/MRDRNA2_/MRDRNA2_137972_c0~~gnl/MRDRNA2_/MRDRNA2_137972_c0_seq1.p1  ORF type:complete len:240 (+),score=63.05 gnl/MRDRNA2_/MRDRNA2_137972_c0_seq1:63-722(+)